MLGSLSCELVGRHFVTNVVKMVFHMFLKLILYLKRPSVRDWRAPVKGPVPTPTPILMKIGVCGGFGLKPHHATLFWPFVA